MTFNEKHYQLCLKIATQAHTDQKRPNGDAYITHPERVSSLVEKYADDNSQKWFFKCVAILHDVIEDTNFSQSVLHELDVHEYIVSCVSAVSRMQSETYTDFIFRVSKNYGASVVKLCDLEDNLSDHEESSRKDKYELSTMYLLKEYPGLQMIRYGYSKY